MAYLGFADGLFGLQYLRFNLGLSMVVLVFLYVYVCVHSADLLLVWCLFDCALRFI